MKVFRVVSAAAIFLLAEACASSPWVRLNQEAVELYDAGKYKQAEILVNKALEAAEKSLGPDHPDGANSLNNLAGLYHAQGRYADAEPLFKRSMAIYEKAFGPNHPDIVLILEPLALLYRVTNREKEAVEAERRAEKIQEGKR